MADSPRITVVGAGVVGVATALSILDALPNCRLSLVSEAFSPHTTGDIAAGFWEPVFFGDCPLEDMTRWGQITWDVFEEWFKRDENWGVSRLPGVFLCDQDPASYTPPAWASVVYGCRKLSEGECRALSPKCRSGITFESYFAEPFIFLPKLMEEIIRRGGKCIQKKVTSLAEVAASCDVLVNCSGLGARFLAGDETVEPASGQVLRVKAPWVSHFHIQETKDDVSYILPNIDSVVLGGTCQIGDWSTVPRPEITDKILANCTKIMPTLKDAEVIGCTVGLRPYRKPGVRLEADSVTIPGGRRVPVVHNYGHGGSGITIMWGCGLEAATLVAKCVGEGGKEKPPQSKL